MFFLNITYNSLSVHILIYPTNPEMTDDVEIQIKKLKGPALDLPDDGSATASVSISPSSSRKSSVYGRISRISKKFLRKMSFSKTMDMNTPQNSINLNRKQPIYGIAYEGVFTCKAKEDIQDIVENWAEENMTFDLSGEISLREWAEGKQEVRGYLEGPKEKLMEMWRNMLGEKIFEGNLEKEGKMKRRMCPTNWGLMPISQEEMDAIHVEFEDNMIPSRWCICI